jgi:hypothetical protein
MHDVKFISSALLIVLSIALVGCQSEPITTTVTETKTIAPETQTTTITATPRTVTVMETMTVTDVVSITSTTTNKTTTKTSSLLEKEVLIDDELVSVFSMYISNVKVTESGVMVEGVVSCTEMGPNIYWVDLEAIFYDSSGVVLDTVKYNDEHMRFIGNYIESIEINYATSDISKIAKCVLKLILVSRE